MQHIKSFHTTKSCFFIIFREKLKKYQAEGKNNDDDKKERRKNKWKKQKLKLH